MHLVESVSLSVRLFVCACALLFDAVTGRAHCQGQVEFSWYIMTCHDKSWNDSVWFRQALPVRGICLCICNQGANADNFKEVVDRLLIYMSLHDASVICTLIRKNIRCTHEGCKQTLRKNREPKVSLGNCFGGKSTRFGCYVFLGGLVQKKWSRPHFSCPWP